MMLFVPSSSSVFGHLVDIPGSDIFITETSFSPSPRTSSTVVGVVWGTEFVVVAAVFVMGAITGVVCDLILVRSRGAAGATYGCCAGAGRVNMGFMTHLGLYPLVASLPSTVI